MKTSSETPTPPPLRLFLIGLNVAAVVITTVIVLFAVMLQRDIAIENANRVGLTLSATLKQHSGLLFRIVRSGLETIGTQLPKETPSQSVFREMTASVVAVADVAAITLLDPDGRLVASSGDLANEQLSRLMALSKADREQGWPIGSPLIASGGADANGVKNTAWFLPILHHTADERWIVALLSLDSINAFYQSLDLQQNGVAGLIRRDGLLLARVPAEGIGKNISGSAFVERIRAGDRSAAVRSTSVVDRVERVATFLSLDDVPVVAYVAIDTKIVSGIWSQSAASLTVAGGFLLFAIATLSVGVYRIALRRRAIESQLATSRTLTQAILEAAADGLLAVDKNGKVLAANPAAAHMLGLSRDRIVGRDIVDLMPADSRDIVSGNTGIRSDTLLPGFGGKAVPVSVIVTKVDDVGLRVVSLHDRHEELQQSAKMAVLEKMRMIGQLTGGVAHDFNNILTIITLNLDMLGKLIADSPVWDKYAEPALRAAKRGAALTGHLLAFARRQPLTPKVIDPNAEIREFKSLLERTLGERWPIELYPAEKPWPLLADAAQLETALVNLAINARDAMPNGGRIVVETHNVVIDEAYAEKVEDLSPGDYVLISVTDEGIGIRSELLERVFEPFFTTKPVGKGSGLGLSMVFGFAKQSKGHVTIYSEIGRGTSVKLYLPRAVEGCDVEANAESEQEELPCLRILVVEDDADVRATAVRALHRLGMPTIEAATAEEALDFVERGVEFDVLFTDVVLPKMTGRELADRVRSKRPGSSVLYTSGYTENAIVHHGRLDPGVVLLSKPYTQAELRAGLIHLIKAEAQSRRDEIRSVTHTGQERQH